MSSLLPTETNVAVTAGANGSPAAGLPLDGQGDSFDLVSMLLKEQQTLTAVEEFASVHETEDEEAHLIDAPAQARYYSKLMPASPPGPGQQYAFNVDLDTCSGCKACVVACHTMNGLDETESWRRVGTLVVGEPSAETATTSLPIAIGVQHVTTACHHCEDPGCLNGCPVKAYDKDPETGIVRHLDDQCIGCKYCTMMCPYEVPKYSKRLGIVRKCDMCHQRLSVGEAPACVQSCPNEAISIQIVEQQVGAPDVRERLVSGAPLSSITRPTTTFHSSDPNKRFEGIAQDHEIDEPAEDHWPLAALLIATQIGVGMLVCERVVAVLGAISGEGLNLETTRWTATVAWGISMVGMNLAPLHLGQPLRSWRIFLGLRTSWLSREAVLLGKFVGLLSLAMGVLWLPVIAPMLPESLSLPEWLVIPDWAAPVLLVGAIVFGLAGLFSSAMIYIATQRTLWRMNRTLMRFGGTTVIGGLLAFGVVLAATSQQVAIAGGLLGTAIALAAAKLVWEHHILLRRESVDGNDAWDRRSQRLVRQHLQSLSKARLVCGWVGVGLLALSVLVGVSSSNWMLAGIAMVGGLVLAAGEYLERLLYFSSVVHDRMPGTLR
ncbi:DmsC/YnfH family molybdoenzyme membrane anchor subunit [Rhodopirellula halodulae]|uniref:DmsC/YnfH family molybdoenzyme membrane anchor subunit n=1 Tax=Rhodopirellula halodulae TaxID=2894198 RepID=UPI001E3E6C82|nr:DmsC/YnfH family molybdoenzyme membrane anchor subunit [Rhodopirellula sp. JC737]MCC9655070.1 dimethyl sulfoxide reductase anchor subunit [Rhodopirellula sp. JC737]